MGMRRHLLGLGIGLLAMDEEHDQEPINYLVASKSKSPPGNPGPASRRVRGERASGSTRDGPFSCRRGRCSS
jgi:hypothetical protein